MRPITVICGISMKDKIELSYYKTDDKFISLADIAVQYPINALLRARLHSDDILKVILVVGKDDYVSYKKNTEYFHREICAINEGINANIEIKIIEMDFEENRDIYKLVGSIVDEVEIESHILVDVTYGSKDLPIVIFTALTFAENCLGCNVSHIIYGQACSGDDKRVESKVFDMIRFYGWNSVIHHTVITDSTNRKNAKELYWMLTNVI